MAAGNQPLKNLLGPSRKNDESALPTPRFARGWQGTLTIFSGGSQKILHRLVSGRQRVLHRGLRRATSFMKKPGGTLIRCQPPYKQKQPPRKLCSDPVLPTAKKGTHPCLSRAASFARLPAGHACERPRYPNTRVPRYPDTRVPGQPGARVPGYPGARVPGYPGTRAPGCSGIWVPG